MLLALVLKVVGVADIVASCDRNTEKEHTDKRYDHIALDEQHDDDGAVESETSGIHWSAAILIT